MVGAGELLHVGRAGTVYRLYTDHQPVYGLREIKQAHLHSAIVTVCSCSASKQRQSVNHSVMSNANKNAILLIHYSTVPRPFTVRKRRVWL